MNAIIVEYVGHGNDTQFQVGIMYLYGTWQYALLCYRATVII